MGRDGFQYEQTPTNTKHIAFLQSLQGVVTGLSLNSNLYSKTELVEVEDVECGDSDKIKTKNAEQESNSTEDDKYSALKVRAASKRKSKIE